MEFVKGKVWWVCILTNIILSQIYIKWNAWLALITAIKSKKIKARKLKPFVVEKSHFMKLRGEIYFETESEFYLKISNEQYF